MIKKGQRTKLDEIINKDKASEETIKLQLLKQPTKQLELTRQDIEIGKTLNPYTYSPFKEKPIWIDPPSPIKEDYKARYKKEREEELKLREPINLKYPELTTEQINVRKLNEKETKYLLDEEKAELDSRFKYRSYQDPIHSQPPETQQYFDINKSSPEELKKDILETYNAFKVVADKFKIAYQEANSFASTDLSFDYSGSYIDIFKRLPTYIENVSKYGIGILFGLITLKKEDEKYDNSSLIAKELITFLKEGVNIFDITPLNIQQKKLKLKTAMENMQKILSEYERKRKVLVRMPKIIGESNAAYLRKKDNREFLKWLDLYFPTEKENFIKESIDDILQDIGDNDALRFNVSSLRRIKTYSEIYYKAQRTIQFQLRQRLEDKLSSSLEKSIYIEVNEVLRPKVSELLQIIQSSTSSNTAELEKYLSSNLDLRGIFQFTQLIFRNKYKEGFESDFNNFKASFLEDFKKQLKYNDLSDRNNALFTIIRSFLDKYSPRGGKMDRDSFDKLSGNEITKLANQYIKQAVISSLPNFKKISYGNMTSFHYPDFSGAGSILLETGSLRINNITDWLLNNVPFLPKEFATSLIKHAFKGSSQTTELIESLDIFSELSYLNQKNSQLALKVLLELLKKSNKYNPDNFSNYFRSSYPIIEKDIQKFEMGYKTKASEEDKVQAFVLAYKNIDSIQRNSAQINKLIEYIHNSASELPFKDFLIMLQNNNYQNYTKVGISRKLLDLYASLKSSGGLKGIFDKYGEQIRQMQDSGFLSKDFERNSRYIISIFNSNKDINPSHPQFKKIFDSIASIETDLQTIKMGDALKGLIKDYQKKDSRLFDLDFSINPTLRFRVLKDKDPRTLRIGIETNCCQRIGGVGEEAARQSFINPLAGVVILEWLNNEEWKLLTQSYFHYVPKDNSYILDNVEYNSQNCRESEINLEAAYALLAQKMKLDFNVDYFLAGKSYSKINTDDFKTKKIQGDPRFFADENGKKSSNYSDFSPANSIDLLSPKFKLDIEKEKLLKKSLRILVDRFLKLSANIIAF